MNKGSDVDWIREFYEIARRKKRTFRRKFFDFDVNAHLNANSKDIVQHCEIVGRKEMSTRSLKCSFSAYGEREVKIIFWGFVDDIYVSEIFEGRLDPNYALEMVLQDYLKSFTKIATSAKAANLRAVREFWETRLFVGPQLTS